MNHRWFTCIVMAVVATSFLACGEGGEDSAGCDKNFAPKCLDKTHYETCSNGIIETKTCGDGLVCRVVETNSRADPAYGAVKAVQCVAPDDLQCTWNGGQCVNGSVVTCTDGKIVQTVKCDNGCADNRCNEAPPQGGKLSDGAACESDVACASGHCVEGKCVGEETPDDRKPDGAACESDVACASGHCVEGKCVGEETPLPPSVQPGDVCDDTFVSYCEDNAAIFCKEGIVTFLPCGSDLCLTSANHMAACYNDKSLCLVEGVEMSECKDKPVTETVRHKCEKMSDGSLHKILMDTVSCGIGCNEDHTACVAETEDGCTCTDTAGEVCNQRGYDSCTIVNGSMKCYSLPDFCLMAGAGDIVHECLVTPSGEYSVSSVCTKEDCLNNGLEFYFKMESNRALCEGGQVCKEGTGLCVDDTVADGGCKESELNACIRNGAKNCKLVNGKPSCYTDLCTEAEINQKIGKCYESSGTADTVTGVCTKADDGSYIYVYHKEKCTFGCSKDGTSCGSIIITVLCDPNDYHYRCDGNRRFYCGEEEKGSGIYTDMIEECSEQKPCYDTGNDGFWAGCISEKEKLGSCTTVGEKKERHCFQKTIIMNEMNVLGPATCYSIQKWDETEKHNFYIQTGDLIRPCGGDGKCSSDRTWCPLK